MDRTMLMDQLAKADRRVVEGERLIARQRELIATLTKSGTSTVEAEKSLRKLIEAQAMHVADWERLQDELIGAR